MIIYSGEYKLAQFMDGDDVSGENQGGNYEEKYKFSSHPGGPSRNDNEKVGNDGSPNLMEGSGEGDNLELGLVPREVVHNAKQVTGGGTSRHIFSEEVLKSAKVIKSGPNLSILLKIHCK